MSESEHPPEWMLPFDSELVSWFDKVKRERKRSFGGEDDDEAVDDGAMMTNDLARGRR